MPLPPHLPRCPTRRSDGGDCTCIVDPDELTSQQAADRIGVSRPFLLSQLTPYRRVGVKARYRPADVAEYAQALTAGEDHIRVVGANGAAAMVPAPDTCCQQHSLDAALCARCALWHLLNEFLTDWVPPDEPLWARPETEVAS